MTRKLIRPVSLSLTVMLVLTACNLPMATPVAPQVEDPPPALTAETMDVLTPVSLAGPPMEVGSTYFFVDGTTLVAVPEGKFIMGHGGDDNPIHEVTLDSFWIYQTAVTNSQYAFCVKTGNCTAPDENSNPDFADPYHANHPVVGVIHEQAAAYCAMVHGRLPTEAEWEKTARGPNGNIYPWGEAAPSCDLLNVARCVGHTTEVTAYPQGKSYYYALDMSGNIFEWVADWYNPSYYSESPAENPTGPQDGTRRSVRSSSFKSEFYYAETARRFSFKPVDQMDDLGFRCVIDEEHLLDFAPFCEHVVVYGDAPEVGPGGVHAFPMETCPEISVTQGGWCGPGDTPQSTVHLNGPEGSTTTVPPDCVPAGGNAYTCSASVTVEICAECEVPLPGDPGCPAGYHLEGGVCTPDAGFPGLCMPGWNFDPLTQCCSAEPGPTGASIPHCPGGTYYSDPPGACVPFPAAGTVCASATVALPVCHSPEDPGNPEHDCPSGQTWTCGPNGCYCR